jgi:adenosine deaminase
MTMTEKDLYEQMKKFPKVDLHRHLEGSILPETFIEIARTYGGSLPADEVEALRPLIQMVNDPPGFQSFLNKFKVFRCFYPCREAIEEIAYRAIKAAAEDAVKYLELRYSPTHFACSGRFNERDVVHWIQSALDRASHDFAIIVIPIATISRDYDVSLAEETLNMISILPPGYLYGLDLAGDEINNSAQPFSHIFTMARDLGLSLTIHAGEAGGVENLYQAVEQFRAARIGHGIRAADDEALMELLQQRNILLEVCLTSNLHTGMVASLKSHPVRKLMEFGVPVSLNTDDPAISGVTLTDDYIKAVQELEFTINDLKALNRAAINHAFYPDKNELKKRLLHLWD